MDLPKKFNVAGNTIDVIIKDHNENGDYGLFNDVTLTITIFKEVKVGEKYYKLSEDQIKNTFYHEMIHAFNWFFNNETDEALAQVFANFLCEFDNSKTY